MPCKNAARALLVLSAIAIGLSAAGIDMPVRFAREFALLDGNRDGDVTREEAASGLRSLGWQHSSASWRDFPVTHPDCKAVPDPVVFIDCVVSRARSSLVTPTEASNNMNGVTDFISLEHEWDLYIGQCSDVSEPGMQPCARIEDDDLGFLCPSLVERGHCLFSCRACPGKVAAKQYECTPHLNTSVPEPGNHLGASDGVSLLITSDWHVEPWYLETLIPDSVVSRFPGAAIDNMFECREHDNVTVGCTMNGLNDPPIDLIESHLSSIVAENASIIFFIGDTQAHDFNGTWNATLVISILMNRTLGIVATHFDASNIFYTAGNHDGPDDMIFVDGGDVPATRAWADQVLAAGIVNNDLGFTYDGFSQVDFFSQIGYYVKRVDPANNFGLRDSNLYVIILNTNLGATNTQQMAAFYQDLATIAAAGGFAYVLGHHPEVTMGWNGETPIVPPQYQPIILGVLSGHVHWACTTRDGSLFTQVPAITQAGYTVGYFQTTISPANTVVNVSIYEEMYTYQAKWHTPANSNDWLKYRGV